MLVKTKIGGSRFEAAQGDSRGRRPRPVVGSRPLKFSGEPVPVARKARPSFYMKPTRSVLLPHASLAPGVQQTDWAGKVPDYLVRGLPPDAMDVERSGSCLQELAI